MHKIKGYFFNAQIDDNGYDRLYNNEDFCSYLDKIVCSGVFPDPEDQLKVEPDTGLYVKVKAGQAWIKGHKTVIYDTTEPIIDGGEELSSLLLAAPSSPLVVNTYYILLKVNDDIQVRKMQIVAETSLPLDFNTDKYLCLATVTVKYGTTTIDETMIKDNRGDPTLCPWVSGLIYQVDPEGIVRDYEAAYEQILSDMRTDFEEWFLSLQQSLAVSANLLQYHKVVTGGNNVTNTIPLDMTGYSFDKRDLFIVNMNGLILSNGYDYKIDDSSDPAVLELQSIERIESNNALDILVIKSSLQSSADGIVTLITGETFVHISDAIYNIELRKLDITNPVSETNKVAITNRNLARVDIFEDTTVDNLSFEKTAAGKILIFGSTTDTAAYVEIPLPTHKGCFIPGASYTLSINNVDLIAADAISVYASVNGTRYTVDVNDGDITFEIPNELTSISLVISVAGLNRDNINTTLAIQLEYGGHKNTWEKNVYNEYTVDGNITPMLYDIINNIWIITENDTGLRAAYFVLNSTSGGDGIQYPLDS